MDELVPSFYKTDPGLQAELASIDGNDDVFLQSYLTSSIIPWRTISWDDILSNYRESWINTDRPLTSEDLGGRVVILDFFTYCCINCMHILPYLKRVETEFADDVKVIGVHSAKFLNEKSTANVANAITRYEIEHPVINDVDCRLWHDLDVHCWPTVVVLGPDGRILLWLQGETRMANLSTLIKKVIDHYRERGQLGRVEPKKAVASDGATSKSKTDHPSVGLKYPGKVAVSPSGRKLAISDTGNHRVVVLDLEQGGRVLESIGGNKQSGSHDGDFSSAQFHSPQGLCWLDEDNLFVADTENHLIRKIDMSRRIVTTVGGVGRQGQDLVGGANGREQEISSPWDVAIMENESGSRSLLIAMAGTHQIWIMPLENQISIGKKSFEPNRLYCLAGSGHEAAKNNSYPHQAAFAQPSGLCVTGAPSSIAYVADSESSSIRAVDLKSGGVKNVVGGDKDPQNLFAFGDQDGTGFDVKLQHPLHVAFCAETGQVYVADSYNHKIKTIDPATRTCRFVPLDFDDRVQPKKLDEPGGLAVAFPNLYIADTNNHRILVANVETWRVTQLQIEQVAIAHETPDGALAAGVDSNDIIVLARSTDSIQIRIRLAKVNDVELNQEAPHAWKLLAAEDIVQICDKNGNQSGRLQFDGDLASLPDIRLAFKENQKPKTTILFHLQLAAYTCDKKSGVCSVRSKKYAFRFSDNGDHSTGVIDLAL